MNPHILSYQTLQQFLQKILKYWHERLAFQLVGNRVFEWTQCQLPIFLSLFSFFCPHFPPCFFSWIKNVEGSTQKPLVRHLFRLTILGRLATIFNFLNALQHCQWLARAPGAIRLAFSQKTISFDQANNQVDKQNSIQGRIQYSNC